MFELHVERGVGNVAARGNVEVMNVQRLAQFSFAVERHRDVARVRFTAEEILGLVFKGVTRDHGHAVVTLLAVDRDVFVTELLECTQRKKFVRAFRFLQT